MKFNSIHVLLTYQCNFECDHCFAWGSPWQTGTFTGEQLEDVFQQALALGTIDEFYFEGGETFLYYPVLNRAVLRATQLGFSTGIVTNGYWATTVEDARLWLRPLAFSGLNKIEISCDLFHGEAGSSGMEHPGLIAAKELGLTTNSITIDPPTGYRDPQASVPGEAISGGDVMYRGRAAHTLTADLPKQPWHYFNHCPYENLVDPGRIHLDPLGNIHLCQGIVVGNLFERPLTEIVEEYDPTQMPIISSLLQGGPAQLAREFSLSHEDEYVDACHLCYTVREQLRPDFEEILTPNQMYGVFEEA